MRKQNTLKQLAKVYFEEIKKVDFEEFYETVQASNSFARQNDMPIEVTEEDIRSVDYAWALVEDFFKTMENF